ncbi:MAG: hypothetical protein ACT4PL_13925 [Phycisphaerales bacterium]
MPIRLLPSAFFVAGLCACAGQAAAQSFLIGVNQSQSTVTYSITINAPFVTSPAGTSHLIGNAAGPDGIVGNADDVATGTRTIPGLINGNTAANTPVNISAGGASASGNSGTTVIRPAGALVLGVNTGAMTSSISGLTIDLLGGTPISISIGVSITYSTFRTRQPTCTILGGFPITVPVDTATVTVTEITATQTPGIAIGTLTPVMGSPGQFDFTADVETTVTVTATLGGEPLDVADQVVIVPVTGRVTITGDSAALTGTVNVANMQTIPGPMPQPPLPFAEPLCNGNLLVNVVIGDTTVNITTNANLTGFGARIPDPPGNPLDFNDDGLVTPDDLDDFITAFFSIPTDPRCDFNSDGVITPDDLDDYITAFFG